MQQLLKKTGVFCLHNFLNIVRRLKDLLAHPVVFYLYERTACLPHHLLLPDHPTTSNYITFTLQRASLTASQKFLNCLTVQNFCVCVCVPRLQADPFLI